MKNALPKWVVSFALGLALGVRWPSGAWIWGVPLLCMGGWLLLARRVDSGRIVAVGMTLFLLLGISHSRRIYPQRFPTDHIVHRADGRQVDLEGVVCDTPQTKDRRIRFTAQCLHVREDGVVKAVRGRALIFAQQGPGGLRYGDRVLVRCRLISPRGPGNPGTFDWRRYLALKGIYVVGYASKGQGIMVVRHGEGGWLGGLLHATRKRIHDALWLSFPDPSREILTAVLLGERWTVSEQVRDAFQVLGVSHLLAISGLHLGLLCLMAFWVVRRILLRMERVVLRFSVDKLALIFSLPVVWVYAAISGFGSATQRALCMATAVGVGLVMDRLRSPYHALALAALVVLLIRPSSLFELSFQLSFMAVLGILYAISQWQQFIWRPWGAHESRVGRAIRHAAMAVFVTACAFLATLPLSVLHFHRVSYVSVPANLVLVPWMGLGILPIGFVGTGLYLISEHVGMGVLWICAWIAQMMGDVLMWAADHIGGAIWLPAPRPWEVVFFYLICVALCNVHRSKMARWAALSLGAIWAVVLAVSSIHGLSHERLRVHVLDVGHGSAVLVEPPGGGAMLVDGGGSYLSSFDIGAQKVAPVLWHKRITRLERVVLTHPHPDHAGGLRFILEAFPVRHVADNAPVHWTKCYREFLDAAQMRGLRPRPLHRGAKFRLGKALIEVLWPPVGALPFVMRGRDSMVNNSSLVLRVSFGRFSMLLPADIEAPAERYLSRVDGLKSTVLLSPHHGSKGSNTMEFLHATRPLIVVVSASGGRKGLLSQQVRERFRSIGATVFHTYRDGMITLESDGRELEVTTYRTKRRIKVTLPQGWRVSAGQVDLSPVGQQGLAGQLRPVEGVP